MKIFPQKYGKGQIVVIARNLKVCIKEMKESFPFYGFKKTLQPASNIGGELGIYFFKRVVD